MRHEESKIQTACITWFRLTPKFRKMYYLLFSIPNGAMLAGSKKQRAIQGKRLKSEGLVPGVADLFLSVPSGDLSGLYIEMKTAKGRQQDSQKEFEKAVIKQGYGYVICRSLDDFQKAVLQYLRDGTY